MGPINAYQDPSCEGAAHELNQGGAEEERRQHVFLQHMQWSHQPIRAT
jgi:hypothetical protein